MSLLFITHDLGIVRGIADVVCVMNGGKIVEQGPVEQVFSAPKHPYTRALLAAEPKDRRRRGPIGRHDIGRRSEGLVSDQARPFA